MSHKILSNYLWSAQRDQANRKTQSCLSHTRMLNVYETHDDVMELMSVYIIAAYDGLMISHSQKFLCSSLLPKTSWKYI